MWSILYYEFALQRAYNIYASSMLTILRPDAEDEISALGYFAKLSNQSVSFADCVSFAPMKKANIGHVFTFDRHFQCAGFKIFL